MKLKRSCWSNPLLARIVRLRIQVEHRYHAASSTKLFALNIYAGEVEGDLPEMSDSPPIGVIERNAAREVVSLRRHLKPDVEDRMRQKDTDKDAEREIDLTLVLKKNVFLHLFVFLSYGFVFCFSLLS